MMYMNVSAQNEQGERELFLHTASTVILSFVLPIKGMVFQI